jgi:phosphotransferase system enzyme I (PtsP)
MVANRFDPLSAPSLRALKLIIDQATRLGCPVTVCGEIGGKPLEAMALIGLGYRSLSMSAAAIGPVKAMILGLDAGRIAQMIHQELACDGSGETLRPKLARYAEQHGIPT